MSKIKIGINGFGRIGRLVFRAGIKQDNIEIVGINDLIDANYMSYMLKYDTTHGRFDGSVEVSGNDLIVNGNTIKVTSERDPANINWGNIGADYVVESTGLFLTEDSSKGHLMKVMRKILEKYKIIKKLKVERKMVEPHFFNILKCLLTHPQPLHQLQLHGL